MEKTYINAPLCDEEHLVAHVSVSNDIIPIAVNVLSKSETKVNFGLLGAVVKQGTAIKKLELCILHNG